jgi:hypothetical protein
MNGSVLIMVLALAVAFTAPAFALEAEHQPTTKADCEKAGMVWKERDSQCKPATTQDSSALRNVLGVIGLFCALIGFVMVCRMWIAERRRTCG